MVPKRYTCRSPLHHRVARLHSNLTISFRVREQVFRLSLLSARHKSSHSNMMSRRGVFVPKAVWVLLFPSKFVPGLYLPYLLAFRVATDPRDKVFHLLKLASQNQLAIMSRRLYRSHASSRKGRNSNRPRRFNLLPTVCSIPFHVSDEFTDTSQETPIEVRLRAQ
jgi:hypothetical protein